ncbi:Trimethyllysine dioxygenase [Karstenula rhodostoma CBS 690.94]|uniref:Trimethyllysine dioxygenase n=1 Tax=Karstenula rhodostoma CBS 690.94 TaxID=1392251 RepID=A0A9P4UAM7_9PLEO|nr:Trimethyllysine dioxygenase [Karstenula rhodostoma CBS 690.94]
MSSFRALLRTRADTRLSSVRSLPSSHFPKPSPQAISQCLRFNSSVSSPPAQDASPDSTPAVEDAKDLPDQDDSSSSSASEATGGYYPRLRQLSDEVLQSQKDVTALQGQILRLRKSLRTTQIVVEGGPFSIIKDWGFNPRKVEITHENDFLRVGQHKIPNVWLRDNCQCCSCVHGETKQRLLDIFSIPEDVSIRTCAEFKTFVEVTWSDGHHSRYDKDLLRAAAQNVKGRAVVRQGHPVRVVTWGSEIAKNKPKCPWLKPGGSMTGYKPNETDDDLILHVLRKIRRYGFCYIQDVPPTPKATKALLKRIAFIRETHYGGFYDFTADLAKADTAYTNIALPAHTDTTYFSDPAGLQAFHLLSHTDGEGGASLLVDGFKAAETLLEEDRDAYRVLATVNVHAHASGNAGISIQPYRGFPVLEHDVETGTLLRVRWNTSDRAAVELPLEDVGTWYAAARKFDAILKRAENEYWEQLRPGTVLIFDNWRVLHGRSEFTGKRRICGGYVNRDDWISRWKMLHFGKAEVLGRLASD